MIKKNSIFEFDEKFEVESPFDDWGKKRNKKWEKDKLDRRIEYHLKTNKKPEDCVEHGLYVKTIEPDKRNKKGMVLVPGLKIKGSINGFDSSDPSPSSDHSYFPLDFELKYISLIHHLQEVPGGIKKLKKKGFWVIVEGECFKFDGTPLGVKQLKVHQDFIVMDEQMKFYFELDRVSDRLNQLEKNGVEIPEVQQAEAFYNAIVKKKNLDLIFKPSDISANSNRLFIGFTDSIQKAELSLTQFEVTGGAAFGLDLENSNNRIFQIGNKIKSENIDKTFDKEEPGILINRINLHFPLIEIRRKGIPGNAVGTAKEGAQAPYPHFTYLNSQEINIAHELIHAHQNTMDAKNQEGRLLGRLVRSDEERGWKRELLAYHFSLFPNKVYSSSVNDPVFKTTNFVRGKSAVFGNVYEISIAFWVWAATRYIFQLENKDGALSNDELSTSIKTCIYDIVKLRTCLEKKGYKFFDGDSYNWDEDWFKKANKSLFKEGELDSVKTHHKQEEDLKEGEGKLKKSGISPITDDTSQVDFDDQNYIDNRKEIEDILLEMEVDLIGFSNSLKEDNPILA